MNDKATKAPTTVINVRMEDGRDVAFAGKRKMIKNTTVNTETGEIVVQMDFVNGQTRYYNVVSSLMTRFAAHGAEQKLGDEIAGVTDVEDCVEAIDQLLTRLDKGEWNVQRESNGMGGASILARALVELTGRTRAQISEFLADKTQAEKIALRANGKLKAIVERMEAERKANSKKEKPQIDSDALLEGLEGAGGVAAEADGEAAAA